MTPPCVLIVDDDADLLDVLEMLLTDDGFRAVSCNTTEEALAALMAESVQLVITDLRLVGSSGLDLIHHMQTLSLPVPSTIVLTAVRPLHAAAELEQIERLGVRIIAKPFDIDDLLAAAREMTGWLGPTSS